AVVTAVDLVSGEAVAQELQQGALQLPGRRVAGRIPVVPGDVDLQRCLVLRLDHIAISGELHRLAVIFEYGLRRGLHHCDDALGSHKAQKYSAHAATATKSTRLMIIGGSESRTRSGEPAAPRLCIKKRYRKIP